MKLILRNNEGTGAADVYDATTKECLKTFENGADALTWIESFDCETDIIRCPRPTLKGKTITINFKTDDDAEDWIAEYFTAFGYDIEYESEGENHGDDMVNHPSHYEKGHGHRECIELLDWLTQGYSGIAAGCIMQAKYLYRAGCKAEEGMTLDQKALQDVKKFHWYMDKFKELARAAAVGDGPLLPDGFRCSLGEQKELLLKDLVYEFTFDKTDEVTTCLYGILKKLINLQTWEDVEDVIKFTQMLENVLSSK